MIWNAGVAPSVPSRSTSTTCWRRRATAWRVPERAWPTSESGVTSCLVPGDDGRQHLAQRLLSAGAMLFDLDREAKGVGRLIRAHAKGQRPIAVAVAAAATQNVVAQRFFDLH